MLLGPLCSADSQGQAGNTGHLIPCMTPPELGLGLRATKQKGLELIGFVAKLIMFLPVLHFLGAEGHIANH